MNDKPNWQVAHIDDIERRGRDIPVREHLGIRAFGINAFTPSEDGTLVNEHDEAGSGQEELYIVLDGKATFEVDGEAVEAQSGSLVYVGPEARRKVTGDGTLLVIGAAPGEAYQGIDWGDAWQFHSESMTAYSEQRYADALESVRVALEHIPGHAGLHYNYACFATLAGDTSDDTFAHLRRAVELRPRFREDARRDDDFDAVRDDPHVPVRVGEPHLLPRPGGTVDDLPGADRVSEQLLAQCGEVTRVEVEQHALAGLIDCLAFTDHQLGSVAAQIRPHRL